MKIRLVGIASIVSMSVTAVSLSVTAHAQTVIDMGRITCAQYLAMSPSTSRDFSAWMSGWFAYQERRTFVDLLKHRKNVESVKSWCQARPQAGVMDALKGAIGQ